MEEKASIALLTAMLVQAGTIIVALINKHERKKQITYPHLNYSLGKVHEEHSDYQKALDYYEKAAEEYDIDSTYRAQALYMAGLMHMNFQQYDQALERLFVAKAIYDALQPFPYQEELSKLYECIADVYSQQNKLNEALEEYVKLYHHNRKVLEVFTKERKLVKRALKNIRAIYEKSECEEPYKDWLAKQLAKKQVFKKIIAVGRAAVSKTARRVSKHPPSPAPSLSTSPASPPAQTPPVSGSPNISDTNSETALCD